MFWKKPKKNPNVESLLAIPNGLIDAHRLADYVSRAELGQDVYAYTAGPDHFWNIWDGETIDPDTGYRGVRIKLGVERG